MQIARGQCGARGVPRVDEIRADVSELVEESGATEVERSRCAQLVPRPPGQKEHVRLAAARVPRILVRDVEAPVEARPELEHERQLETTDASPIEVLRPDDALRVRDQLDQILRQ